MFLFCITLAALVLGVLFGMAIAEDGAARRQVARLKQLEEKAFKRGELAAWQEANRRLMAGR